MGFRAIRARAFCLALLCVGLLASVGVAQDKRFRLAIPEEIAQTGVPRFLVPRFALKHGIRTEIVAPGTEAEAGFVAGAPPGSLPAFEADGTLYSLILHADDPDSARFADWLTSDIGRSTIDSYAGEDVALALPKPPEKEKVVRELTGNAARGLALSEALCARCHVVEETNRMRGIGSTPSFFVLRALPDWQDRFLAFYALNPHPAFTQVEGVTEEFPEDRPSPIAPIEVTLEGVEDILAYVSSLPPADLGAPVQSR